MLDNFDHQVKHCVRYCRPILVDLNGTNKGTHTVDFIIFYNVNYKSIPPRTDFHCETIRFAFSSGTIRHCICTSSGRIQQCICIL